MNHNRFSSVVFVGLLGCFCSLGEGDAARFFTRLKELGGITYDVEMRVTDSSSKEYGKYVHDHFKWLSAQGPRGLVLKQIMEQIGPGSRFVGIEAVNWAAVANQFGYEGLFVANSAKATKIFFLYTSAAKRSEDLVSYEWQVSSIELPSQDKRVRDVLPRLVTIFEDYAKKDIRFDGSPDVDHRKIFVVSAFGGDGGSEVLFSLHAPDTEEGPLEREYRGEPFMSKKELDFLKRTRPVGKAIGDFFREFGF